MSEKPRPVKPIERLISNLIIIIITMPTTSTLVIVIVAIIFMVAGISFLLMNKSNSGFDINKFVKENYRCSSEPKFCNNLVMLDCGAKVDGPLYYLNKNNGEQISVCGGACLFPQGKQIEVCRTLCPPKEWNCK